MLLGCAPCPTFGDMTVEDPDDLASDNMLADIDAALSDFAAWTGRDGVCVPRIEVQEDVDVERDPYHNAVGVYQGEHSPILIEAGRGAATHDIVVHELCHALDYHEGLGDTWPEDAFPADSVETNLSYPTVDSRVHEAFARSCSIGPSDLGITAALDEQCGTAQLTDAQEFLTEVVYPAFQSELDPAPFGVTVDARPVAIRAAAGVQGEYEIEGAVGYEGEVLVLVTSYDAEMIASAVILRVEPATGDLLGRIEIPAIGPKASAVVMAVSDGDPIALVQSFGTTVTTTEAFRIDPGAEIATKIDLSGLPRASDAAAYMHGVLYVADVTTATLASWDVATGVRTDLPSDSWVFSLAPTPEGLERAGWDCLPAQCGCEVDESGGQARRLLGGQPTRRRGASLAWRSPGHPCIARRVVRAMAAPRRPVRPRDHRGGTPDLH